MIRRSLATAWLYSLWVEDVQVPDSRPVSVGTFNVSWSPETVPNMSVPPSKRTEIVLPVTLPLIEALSDWIDSLGAVPSMTLRSIVPLIRDSPVHCRSELLEASVHRKVSTPGGIASDW